MSDEPLVDYRPNAEGGTPSPEPPVEKPEYVTRKDLDEFGNIITEKLTRFVQSKTDKSESEVTKKLEKWIEALKSQGVTPSDAMVNQKKFELASQKADRAISEDAPPRQVLPEGMTQQKFEAEKARIFARKAELEAELGVTLDADDLDEINWDISRPPDKIIASIERAVRGKAAEGGSAPRVPPNAARVPAPSGASGNPVEQITNELAKLQNKSNRTFAEDKRRAELEAELMKFIPRG